MVKITSEAVTKMHEEKKQAVADKMAARIKAEETKLIARRAAEEQRLAARSEKKTILHTAQSCEQRLLHFCTQLEEAVVQKSKNRTTLETLTQRRKAHNTKLATAMRHLQEAQKNFDLLNNSIKDIQHDIDTLPIKHLEPIRNNLHNALNQSEAAWDKVQKAIRKKTKDRAIKKRAKDLLK